MNLSKLELSKLELSELCRAFDRADPVRISYSLNGTPSLTLKTAEQEYTDLLSTLELRTNRLIDEIQINPQSPERIVQLTHLVHKVSVVQDLSKTEIKNASLISRLFFRLKEWLAKLFDNAKLEDRLTGYKDGYVYVPLEMAKQNGFIHRFPPHSYDSFSKDPYYSHGMMDLIYSTLYKV